MILFLKYKSTVLSKVTAELDKILSELNSVASASTVNILQAPVLESSIGTGTGGAGEQVLLQQNYWGASHTSCSLMFSVLYQKF